MSWFGYNTKRLLQVLEKFAESEEGHNAEVQLLLPAGRSPEQREFNIKEIKLVDNKIIGAKEKYRLMILVE
jgi:hypothetical protein